jgi:glycerol-3-phosphate O-acyltransferase
VTWLFRRLLALWVRYQVRPEDIVERLRARTNPVCYVLEAKSFTDLAVLQSACVRLKLVRPRKRLLAQGRELRSFFYLSRPRGFWDERQDRRPPAYLVRMIEILKAHPELDIDLVPVAVYWGRTPQKEGSWLRLLVVEEWAITSRLRKFLQVLVNGRNTLMEIHEPVSLRGLLSAEGGIPVQGRRVTRALRSLYARQRTARIGPDLSHRRTLVTGILGTRAVRAAVAQERREKKITRRQAMMQARKYAQEIAANYSPAFVRFLEHILTWLWNRLYDGVQFTHVETLERAAETHEIVYVPCHRSHMDYLLLSYAIFRHGYAVPHIAAGINLNIPVVGRFLRKGGAFFIRRSLRGNALYTVVFMNYLAAIMARGHSLEYFIEGGRSRTGRLLQPKTGMLAMTVRSFLRDPARPVMFLPVYFGYERIFEGSTYIGELAGAPKQKESVFGLLRALPRLKERFGEVHVSLGEPIVLGELLETYDRDWRARAVEDDARLPWINAAVGELSQRIMRNINAAAAVTPINLLAVTLLATPRQTLPEADLVRQLELYQALLARFPYSPRVTVSTLTAAQMIAYGESMQVVARQAHPLGDLVRMSDASAVRATYFRNNVLHLFAMPSLVACAFTSNATMSTADLHRLARRIYPYIASELFLRWQEEEVPSVVDGVLAALAAYGLVEPNADQSEWRRPPPTSVKAVQLSLLAQATIQTIERYYLAVALLLQAGSGEITQYALEERCQLLGQRMTMLYGFNSPEFFDRTMFENFIDLLRARGVIRIAAGGKLAFDAVLTQVAQDAQLVLQEQMRHSILQITHS